MRCLILQLKIYCLNDLCTLEIDGAVARLTFTREDVFNALNIQLISEIISGTRMDQGAFRW